MTFINKFMSFKDILTSQNPSAATASQRAPYQVAFISTSLSENEV